jgi:hypothetical protein
MENFIQLSLNELQINRFIVIDDFHMKNINCANIVVRSAGVSKMSVLRTKLSSRLSHAACVSHLCARHCRVLTGGCLIEQGDQSAEHVAKMLPQFA